MIFSLAIPPPLGVGLSLTLYSWVGPGPPLPFLLAGPLPSSFSPFWLGLAFASFGSEPGQTRPEGPTPTPEKEGPTPTQEREGPTQQEGPTSKPEKELAVNVGVCGCVGVGVCVGVGGCVGVGVGACGCVCLGVAVGAGVGGCGCGKLPKTPGGVLACDP